MAYAIWMIEKEFHIGGIIDDDFPLMKFLNLYDEYNLRMYKDGIERSSKETGKADTFR